VRSRNKSSTFGPSLLALRKSPEPFGPAATLRGGLRPGSLRVHDPCNEGGHGSRLGFPGRRLPRGPAAPANVARALQALLKQDASVREGEGSWAWTRRNLVCGRPGSRRRSAAQVGVAILVPHDSLGAEVQGSARATHGIVPPGKTHSPSPPGLGCQREPRSEGPKVLSDMIRNPWNFSPTTRRPFPGRPFRFSLQATHRAARRRPTSEEAETRAPADQPATARHRRSRTKVPCAKEPFDRSRMSIAMRQSRERASDMSCFGDDEEVLCRAVPAPLQPTTSSPPSTPITLPVIQCVPGRLRPTMASATSAVVVRR